MRATLFAPSSVPGTFGIPNALRDFAAPALLLPAALFFPSEWLIYVFVIVGQGHFLMTCLYQYKGGKMNSTYLFTALLLLVGAFVYLQLIGEQGLYAYLFIALIFPIHAALNEFTLHSEQTGVRGAVTALLVAAIAFVSTLVLALPNAWVLFILTALAVVLYSDAFVRIVRKRDIARTEWYLWCVALFTILLVILGRPEQVLSSIIILHCFNWLVGFGQRVKGNKAKAQEYWWLTFWTHLAAFLGFIAFHMFTVEPLRYFFLLVYYDFWAIAHVILTWRRSASRGTAILQS